MKDSYAREGSKQYKPNPSLQYEAEKSKQGPPIQKKNKPSGYNKKGNSNSTHAQKDPIQDFHDLKAVQGTAMLQKKRNEEGEFQLKKDEESLETLQQKEQDNKIQLKETAESNNTGLPDNLKAGVENLSGYSMDQVKVHYNSDKPAQVQAHAYAQGTDIYLASGQEKHLPHEAWHVVQQQQGRVKPTVQLKGGVKINDESGLEKEADVMGAKAIQTQKNEIKPLENITLSGNERAPIQGVFEELYVLAAEYAFTITAGLFTLIGIYGLSKIISFIKAIRSRGGNINHELAMVSSGAQSLDESEGSKNAPPKTSSLNDSNEDSPTKSVEKGTDEALLPVIKGEKSSKNEKPDSLLEGVAGDCLYTAVAIARGLEGEEAALRQVATEWLLQCPPDHEIFDYADVNDLVLTVSTAQSWTGDPGDLSPVVLAYSTGITLRVVTAANVYVFNPGNQIFTIYFHNEHYTSFPVNGVHNEGAGEIISKPKNKKEIKPFQDTSLSSNGKGSSFSSGGAPIESESSSSKKVDISLSKEVEDKEKILQQMRNLKRVLGNTSTLSNEDKAILDILRKVDKEDDYTKKDKAAYDNYLKKDKSKPSAYQSSSSLAPPTTPPPPGYTLVSSGKQQAYLADPNGHGPEKVALDHIVGAAHGERSKIHRSSKMTGTKHSTYVHPNDHELYTFTLQGNHTDGIPMITIHELGVVRGGFHNFGK